MAAPRLHLSELIDFLPDQGTIRLHQQRVVLLSAAAMGLLRKEIIETIGAPTARRLLMRFGYADGYHDAVTLRDRSAASDPIEAIRNGTVLHTLEGIVRSRVVRADHDEASGQFTADVEWHNSYEAEQHVHHYGASDDPVCWSLVGYISGYASACLGQEVYFREESCSGQGGRRCLVRGMDAEHWGDQLAELRFDFQGADLAKEIERLRTAAKRQVSE